MMRNNKKARVRMPSATSVVARSYPDKIIGIENQLPWHLGSDLKMFKERTLNHAVIMGRKTFDSIGKPLPRRVNIVLSRSSMEDVKGVLWAPNPETALFLADVHTIIDGQAEFFVIGGENIYKIFERYINRVVMTEVYSGNLNGDAKFEFEYREMPEWRTVKETEFRKSEIDDFDFRVTEFVRRKPEHRYRMREEFMGRVPDFEKWLSVYEKQFDQAEKDDQLGLFPKDLAVQ